MVDEPVKPVEADVRFEDQDYNPAMEPKKAKAWLNLLLESEDAFEDWNNHCDKIDKQYASLQRLSDMARDKEFQMFWANCEVLKPIDLRQAADPRGGAEIQGQETGLPGRQRGDGAVLRRRVRSRRASTT